VIATVRDPSHTTALSLLSLPKASESHLIIIEMDAASPESIKAAIASLTTLNISSIDIVIANAGICAISGPLSSTPTSELQMYIDVNAYGPFNLFKAVAPRLRTNTNKGLGKGSFVLISSAGGSLAGMMDIVPLGPYGASKALANFLVKWLGIENTDLVIWAQHPG
jgi:norsolorinic acid ketoreductase